VLTDRSPPPPPSSAGHGASLVGSAGGFVAAVAKLLKSFPPPSSAGGAAPDVDVHKRALRRAAHGAIAAVVSGATAERPLRAEARSSRTGPHTTASAW
jgi:hypothetical protein